MQIMDEKTVEDVMEVVEGAESMTVTEKCPQASEEGEGGGVAGEEGGVAGEEEEEEEMWNAAHQKYQEFNDACGDLLDPSKLGCS